MKACLVLLGLQIVAGLLCWAALTLTDDRS